MHGNGNFQYTQKGETQMAVRFHLPGLRYNYPLNMLFASLLKLHPEYFREGVEIASFFGEFPLSLWNGGRLSMGDQCDSRFIQEVVKNINAQGIPIRYTYTNPLLTEEDVSDPYCNFCMQVADNGMNEVIVVSPILEEYIRKNYPNFKINSSTCKEIRTWEQLNAELDRDYHMVVLDYNLNNQFDMLEKIEKKDKVEILINPVCVPNCQRRGEHYKNVGINQRIILENRKNPPEKQQPIVPWQCEYGDKNCVHTLHRYNTFISPEQIWEKYVPMGFSNFKIEGRTANIFSLIETYCFYMIKPEKQGEARLMLINNLVANKIVTVNRPRPSRWP